MPRRVVPHTESDSNDAAADAIDDILDDIEAQAAEPGPAPEAEAADVEADDTDSDLEAASADVEADVSPNWNDFGIFDKTARGAVAADGPDGDDVSPQLELPAKIARMDREDVLSHIASHSVGIDFADQYDDGQLREYLAYLWDCDAKSVARRAILPIDEVVWRGAK